MIPKINPCCRCGKVPTKVISEPGDIFYVKCNCGKWSKYEFLGATRKGAIEHWNDMNRAIKRTGHPRGKDALYD